MVKSFFFLRFYETTLTSGNCYDNFEHSNQPHRADMLIRVKQHCGISRDRLGQAEVSIQEWVVIKDQFLWPANGIPSGLNTK